MTAAASRGGQTTGAVVTNSHESIARERRHVETLRRYRADGLIVTSVDPSPAGTAHLQTLREEGYPFVCLYREVPGLAPDYCGTDVYAATRRLVVYLAGELGHRHIAVLSGNLAGTTNPTRIAGWRDELAARDLPASDDLLVVCPSGQGGGEAGTHELLARGVRCTAIVCLNDFIALEALRALHEVGKRVPDDLSVAGMGGFTAYSPPDKPLTTMADDYLTIGRVAGSLLLRRIAGRGEAGHERRIVPARLRPGLTTGVCARR